MAEIHNLPHGAAGGRPPAALALAADREPGARFDPLALLLADTATGHERAFARLYELTGGRLLSIARGIVGRADLAEDVLQESFLRIWRSAHQYDPAKGAAYAWLVTIVRNRALTAKVRSAKLEQTHEEPDVDAIASDIPDPAAQAMRSEEARRVNACLANLPLNHRRSVALVYFEGLTHKELAERLDVQLGTAKSWVRRGLAQMGYCLSGGVAAHRRDLVAADYAIGSLRGGARRGFERRRERDARYCHAADRWDAQLALLTEFLPEAGPPPAYLWKRIEQEVRRARISFARPLVWQVATVALGIATLALIVALAV